MLKISLQKAPHTICFVCYNTNMFFPCEMAINGDTKIIIFKIGDLFKGFIVDLIIKTDEVLFV